MSGRNMSFLSTEIFISSTKLVFDKIPQKIGSVISFKVYHIAIDQSNRDEKFQTLICNFKARMVEWQIHWLQDQNVGGLNLTPEYFWQIGQNFEIKKTQNRCATLKWILSIGLKK